MLRFESLSRGMLWFDNFSRLWLHPMWRFLCVCLLSKRGGLFMFWSSWARKRSSLSLCKWGFLQWKWNKRERCFLCYVTESVWRVQNSFSMFFFYYYFVVSLEYFICSNLKESVRITIITMVILKSFYLLVDNKILWSGSYVFVVNKI